MNLPFITFILLLLGVPYYERYERLHHPDNPIPTRVKWTAQLALGSATAAHSVCKIVSFRRRMPVNSVYCTSLGVAGGAMSSGAMMARGGWGDAEWAYYDGVVERLGGHVERLGFSVGLSGWRGNATAEQALKEAAAADGARDEAGAEEF